MRTAAVWRRGSVSVEQVVERAGGRGRQQHHFLRALCVQPLSGGLPARPPTRNTYLAH
jgi:hypothetical protein